MKTIKIKTQLVLLTIIFSFGWILSAQNTSENLQKELQTKLDEIQKEVNFPGVTCAIVMPDNSIIKLASGYADVEENIKMKKDDRMFSGSTGKTFVGAVILQLLEEGKLSLSDKVNKYLGEYEWYKRIPNYKKLTISMLTHHTGGLPRYVFMEKFNDDVLLDIDKVWTPEERLSYIFDKKPIHPAGKGWYYSDTGYIVLGMIIEKICGQSLYEEVQQRFIEPMNLTSTEPAISRTLIGLVQGHSGENPYINAPNKVISNGMYFFNPQLEWCGGGFISTAPDLARWGKLFFSGEIFNEKVRSELYSTVDLETGMQSETGYGVANIISETMIGRKIGHTGLMMGYITEIGYYEKYDFAIAIQVNQDNFQGNEKNLGKYSYQLASIISKYLKNN